MNNNKAQKEVFIRIEAYINKISENTSNIFEESNRFIIKETIGKMIPALAKLHDFCGESETLEELDKRFNEFNLEFVSAENFDFVAFGMVSELYIQLASEYSVFETIDLASRKKKDII
jgi:hypothetical protein